MLTIWHTMLEKYLVYSSPLSRMFLHKFFSNLIKKKSLQMLRESRREKLKIPIAPLNIKLSSLKSMGTVSTVVQAIMYNLNFITKINGHIL